VIVGALVQDTKPLHGSKEDTPPTPKDLPTTFKDHPVASVVAPSTVESQTNVVSSPSKQLSPADVSGTNEEWETASEGSDGGLHPRRQQQTSHVQTTHRQTPGKYSTTAECSMMVDSVKPCIGPVSSPCVSGVSSNPDFNGPGWNEMGSGSYAQYRSPISSVMHVSNGLSEPMITGSTKTDSADVAINQLHSSGLAASSRLFAVSFSDPGTQQPTIHDPLTRLAVITFSPHYVSTHSVSMLLVKWQKSSIYSVKNMLSVQQFTKV